MSELLRVVLVLSIISGMILLGAYLTVDPFGGEGEG